MKEEVDIFRDTPLRYLGYANEVGEAFRSLVSKSVVHASYGLAFGYVFMDVIDKGRKTYLKETTDIKNNDSALAKTAKVSVDCLLWQTFASVLVPGFTINRICKFSSILLHKTDIKKVKKSSKILTTLIGLASIPLIIHPIDHGCHVVMDKTVRPLLGIEPHLNDNKDQ